MNAAELAEFIANYLYEKYQRSDIADAAWVDKDDLQDVYLDGSVDMLDLSRAILEKIRG